MSQTTNALGQLETIAATLRGGGTPPRLTVREFLRWFGAQRRGYWIVKDIRRVLQQAELRTSPDFESTWIDGQISFVPADLPPKPRDGETGIASMVSGTANTVPPPPATAEIHEASPSESPSTAEDSESPAVGDSGSMTETVPVASAPETESSRSAAAEASSLRPAEPPIVRVVAGDPTHRISKLEAANHPPVSVGPDSTLGEAVTIMLTNDFSQVPVMPSERDVKGIVTWQSIGSRLALGRDASTARDVMDAAAEIRSDSSIFAAIPDLVEHGYVLVRGPDGRIVGIVTSSDLSLQFRQLAEPFLLLSEIENRIRNIIASHFNPAELAGVRDPDDDERKIESVDDLTFGEYIRLLEEPDRWGRIAMRVDRKYFIESLDNIRRIRNDVMHFDPDGIPPEDTVALRDFARFLQKLETIGVT